MQSTLRRRMMLHLSLMLSGSLLMGIGAVIGVNGVHNDLKVALQGNQQLRQIYEVGVDVATAKRELNAAHPDSSAALLAIQTAMIKLDHSDFVGPQLSLNWLDESKRIECRSRLLAAAHELMSNDHRAQSAAVNNVLGLLSNLSSDIRSIIATKQKAADDKRHRTLDLTVALFAVVVLTAIVIGLRQYQSVMRPLNRISGGVHNFTAGRLDQRIAAAGDREFVALANDFNQMAAELEGLYRHLEEKVAAKSKELVRSERLASVGYLAAGVAHEMNNPLGIIAGYGERSLQQLARGLDENSLPNAQRAIKIICEEAFRCKEITERLLSLARPGSDDRSPVPIPAVAQQVISSLGGLPEYSNRRMTLEAPSGAQLCVLAKESEIRQVLVNLLLNALQATSPGNGEVRVSIASLGNIVEISVCDNGCGMTAQTIDRVFEPFFTDKRGQQRPGTGLGLSITHAIVLDHGGRITAESDGPGKGSRFIIQLPKVETSGAGKEGDIVAVS